MGFNGTVWTKMLRHETKRKGGKVTAVFLFHILQQWGSPDCYNVGGCSFLNRGEIVINVRSSQWIDAIMHSNHCLGSWRRNKNFPHDLCVLKKANNPIHTAKPIWRVTCASRSPISSWYYWTTIVSIGAPKFLKAFLWMMMQHSIYLFV